MNYFFHVVSKWYMGWAHRFSLMRAGPIAGSLTISFHRSELALQGDILKILVIGGNRFFEMTVALFFCGAFAFTSQNAFALKSESKVFESFDGFPLDGVIEWPETADRSLVNRVLVFIHGSGAQSMDEDLSAISTPKGVNNPFFKILSAAVVNQGWGTLRYNKRSFQFQEKIAATPEIKKAKHFLKFQKKPLEHFIRDAMSMALAAKREFPAAEVYVLGHSEGSTVALQASRRQPQIKGHVLIGFSNESLNTLLLEQTVYRPLHLFTSLDKDLNEVLDVSELGGKDEISKSLRDQMKILDLDEDKKLSMDEFKAGNYSNLVAKSDLIGADYQQEEAKLPRPSEILRETSKKTLFLQGTYDNQTPVYFTKAVDLVNRTSWKKKELRFVYFEKAGHTLDLRDSSNDLKFRVLGKETLARVGSEIQTFFQEP